MDKSIALELWARLATEGRAQTELTSASEVLSAYSVGIEPWVDRIAQTYLQQLSRRNAHSKLVIAPYGGGKTHFLMALGSRALKENFAVSYIACKQGVTFNNSMDVYKAFIKKLLLPDESNTGMRAPLQKVIKNKREKI